MKNGRKFLFKSELTSGSLTLNATYGFNLKDILKIANGIGILKN